MLSGIIDGIKAIVNAITTAFDFLVSFFGDLLDFIAQLIKLPVTIYNYLTMFLPAPIVAGIGSAIAIVIVVRVIGRD